MALRVRTRVCAVQGKQQVGNVTQLPYL
jgi:hypothetical protein